MVYPRRRTRVRRLRATLILLISAATMVVAGVALAGDPSGTWVMANGKVTVRIGQCATKLCARIVGLEEPLDSAGQPQVDKLNPNAALRRRPLIGLMLTSDIVPSGNNNWTGLIYNPDDGRTYSASLRLSGQVMQVRGCVAGILCKSND